MILAVVVAAFFHCNKVSAAMGVWLTNPITAPFFYGAQFYVGAWLTGINISEINLTALDLNSLATASWKLFWLVTVGGVVVGIPISLTVYWIALKSIQQFRKRQSEKIVKCKQDE